MTAVRYLDEFVLRVFQALESLGVADSSGRNHQRSCDLLTSDFIIFGRNKSTLTVTWAVRLFAIWISISPAHLASWHLLFVLHRGVYEIELAAVQRCVVRQTAHGNCNWSSRADNIVPGFCSLYQRGPPREERA